jgi:molecular chaperone DnaJ
MSKKGHAGSGGPAGDLMIHVKVKPHAYFKRENSDIHTDVRVNLSQVSILKLF